MVADVGPGAGATLKAGRFWNEFAVLTRLSRVRPLRACEGRRANSEAVTPPSLPVTSDGRVAVPLLLIVRVPGSAATGDVDTTGARTALASRKAATTLWFLISGSPAYVIDAGVHHYIRRRQSAARL